MMRASRSSWSSIELLSGPAEKRGPVTVFREGDPVAGLFVSSSHCGPYTACCASGDAVGLDLARVEPRCPEFYSGSFSAQERAWVKRACARDRMDTAFTLLWCVKEAYLKVSTHSDLSIWSFPNWTVWLEESLETTLQSKSPERLTCIPAAIEGCGFSAALQIGTMRIDDMVLTTVQYQEPGMLNATIGRLDEYCTS
jgi:hypothetical protein